MDASSSARAVVEYHDPFNLFSYIKPGLDQIVPLRQLHWTSGLRAARTIDSLHIRFQAASEFVGGDGDGGSNQLSRSGTGPSDPGAAYPAAGGPRFAVRERRHQMPGLRIAPLVRMLLVRCDDADTYKRSLKKFVRDWVRQQSPTKRSSSSSVTGNPDGGDSEPHEAFDWLVVHVVMPDTAVAAQPRFSAGLAAEKSDGGIWSRPSPTVFERLRTDLNASGRAPADRVCQVRVPRLGDDTAPDQEALAGWSDVAGKLRTMVLAAFDRRLKQYSEDIRERTEQRTLPGWNFCTYFILKEGLARGYESVGLIEDAMAEYDELAVGLQSAALEVDVSVLSHTATMADLYVKAASVRSSKPGTDNDTEPDTVAIPITGERGRCRERIVGNQVSIFEFELYLFARQAALLLRLSNPSGPVWDDLEAARLRHHGPNGGGAAEGADLLVLAELGRRAAVFIGRAAGLLRQDIRVGVAEPDEKIIDAVAASWTYAAIGQILDRLQLPSGQAESENRARTGQDEYCAARAELVMLQRRVIERVAEAGSGWRLGVAGELRPDTHSRGGPTPGPAVGIIHQGLSGCVASRDAFVAEYRRLSEQAVRLFDRAGRTIGRDAVAADLAVERCSEGDDSAAAACFSRAAADYGRRKWNQLENRMLELHGRTADALERPENYLDSMIRRLEKGVAAQAEQPVPAQNDDDDKEILDTPDDQQSNWTGLLSAVLEAAAKKQQATVIPIRRLFGFSIDRQIHHLDQQDGFEIVVTLRHWMPDPITFDRGRVVLAGLGGNDGHDIEAHLAGPATVEAGTASVTFRAHNSSVGVFSIGSVELSAGQLTFTYNHSADFDSPDPGDRTRAVVQPSRPSRMAQAGRVHCFPPPKAFAVSALPAFDIATDTRRLLHLVLSAGWNDVTGGDIRVRPRTAGLRLYSADVFAPDGDISLSDGAGIGFGPLPSGKTATIALPYSLDSGADEIVVAITITYRVDDRQHTVLTVARSVVGLPLDVSVHDAFKTTALHATFVLRPTAGVPVAIGKAVLSGSNAYSVRPPPRPIGPLVVHPGGSAAVVYSLAPVSQLDRPHLQIRSGPAVPLRLVVDYRRLDDDVADAAVSQLTADLAADPSVYRFSRLVLPIFATGIRARVSQGQLSRALLRHRLELGPASGWEWAVALGSLVDSDRTTLLTWLVDWHAKHADMSVQFGQGSGLRRLDIAVPVPSVPVMCSARLKLPARTDKVLARLNGPVAAAAPVVAVGQPIDAIVAVSWTSRWDFSNGLRPGVGSNRDFVVHLDAPVDSWAIGGGRRRRFSVGPDKKATEFKVTLVPLRAGRLLLPSVDVVSVEAGVMPVVTMPAASASATSLAAPVRRSRSRSVSRPKTQPAPVVAPVSTIAGLPAVTTVPVEVDYSANSVVVTAVADVVAATVAVGRAVADVGMFVGGVVVVETESR